MSTPRNTASPTPANPNPAAPEQPTVPNSPEQPTQPGTPERTPTPDPGKPIPPGIPNRPDPVREPNTPIPPQWTGEETREGEGVEQESGTGHYVSRQMQTEEEQEDQRAAEEAIDQDTEPNT